MNFWYLGSFWGVFGFGDLWRVVGLVFEELLVYFLEGIWVFRALSPSGRIKVFTYPPSCLTIYEKVPYWAPPLIILTDNKGRTEQVKREQFDRF